MDRFKIVGHGLKLAYVAYYRRRRRIIWAMHNGFSFKILENKSEENFIRLGTISDLRSSAANIVCHVSFHVSDRRLFIAKANEL